MCSVFWGIRRLKVEEFLLFLGGDGPTHSRPLGTGNIYQGVKILF
jgi:hypothetical protein